MLCPTTTSWTNWTIRLLCHMFFFGTVLNTRDIDVTIQRWIGFTYRGMLPSCSLSHISPSMLLVLLTNLPFSYWSVPWPIPFHKFFCQTSLTIPIPESLDKPLKIHSSQPKTPLFTIQPPVDTDLTTAWKTDTSHWYPLRTRKPIQRFGFASNKFSLVYLSVFASVHAHSEPTSCKEASSVTEWQ